jgi:hypothetical protein
MAKAKKKKIMVIKDISYLKLCELIECNKETGYIIWKIYIGKIIKYGITTYFGRQLIGDKWSHLPLEIEKFTFSSLNEAREKIKKLLKKYKENNYDSKIENNYIKPEEL